MLLYAFICFSYAKKQNVVSSPSATYTNVRLSRCAAGKNGTTLRVRWAVRFTTYTIKLKGSMMHLQPFKNQIFLWCTKWQLSCVIKIWLTNETVYSDQTVNIWIYDFNISKLGWDITATFLLFSRHHLQVCYDYKRCCQNLTISKTVDLRQEVRLNWH